MLNIVVEAGWILTLTEVQNKKTRFLIDIVDSNFTIAKWIKQTSKLKNGHERYGYRANYK